MAHRKKVPIRISNSTVEADLYATLEKIDNFNVHFKLSIVSLFKSTLEIVLELIKKHNVVFSFS